MTRTYFYNRRLILLIAGLVIGGIIVYATRQSAVSLPPGLIITLHTLIGFLAAVLAAMIFFNAWNSYTRFPFQGQHFVLGLFFLFAAVTELAHVLSFPGMPLYQPHAADTSAKVWLIGRLAQAGAFLFCPLMTTETRIRVSPWTAMILTAALAVTADIFLGYRSLPVLYIPGDGITATKVLLEFLVMSLFLAASYLHRRKLSENGGLLFQSAFFLIVLAQLCFISSSSEWSTVTLLGHFFYLGAYACFLASFIKSNFDVPFRKLDAKCQRLDYVLNNSPLPIVTTESDGTVTFANRAYLQMASSTGLQKVIGRPLDAVLPGLAPSDREAIRETLSEGKATEVQGTLVCTPGIIRQVKINAYPIRGEDSKIRGSFITVQDVQAQADLANLQRLHSTVLDLSMGAIVVVNRNGFIAAVNREAERLFGLERQNLLGKDYHTVFRENLQLKTEVGLSAAMKTGRRSDFTEVQGAKSKYYLIATDALRDQRGDIVGAVANVVDISPWKAREQMTQQRVKLALVGQMAAGITHEVKNPLTAIHGFSQLLMERYKNDATLYQQLKIIKEEAEKAFQLITDFLQFARPKEPVIESLNIAEVLHSVVNVIEAEAFLQNVRVELFIEPEMDPVNADRSQIKQVLFNLAQNAIQAMPHGGKLTFKARRQGAGQVCIAVADTGQGIHPEDLAKLGTPFFSTKEQGTGLGLSICYSIIHSHGGQLTVDSTVGQGTEFRIILPCALAKQ
ncbi:MAG: MASE3 domain-containing protein [Bacillota bacterium]